MSVRRRANSSSSQRRSVRQSKHASRVSIGPLEPGDVSSLLRRAGSGSSSRRSGSGGLLSCRHCMSRASGDDESAENGDLRCIKVHCSSVDPSHMYRVLPIDQTTTAGEVIHKMLQHDGVAEEDEGQYFLLYTKFSGPSLASLLPPRVLDESEQLYPLHMEEKTGRIELLKTLRPSPSPPLDTTFPRDAERMSSPAPVERLQREPSSSSLFNLLISQTPVLVDTVTRELVVLPQGVVGVFTSAEGSACFAGTGFTGAKLHLRDCDCESAFVVINRPSEALVAVPLPSRSGTVALDSQPLTEPLTVPDNSLLRVGARSFRVRTPARRAADVGAVPLPLTTDAGDIDWTTWLQAVDKSMPTSPHALSREISEHVGRSSLDDQQALQLFLEMEEQATRDASTADVTGTSSSDTGEGEAEGRLFGQVGEEETPNHLEVTTTTAERAYEKWRLLKKGMLTNKCDVDMEAVHQAEKHRRQPITVRPLLITWLKLVGTVMAVEKARARDIHNIFDGDNDGKLTRSDLYGASQHFELGFTPQEADALFEFLDSNRDGYIDVMEFSKHVRVVHVRSEFFSDRHVQNAGAVVPANELISRISADSGKPDPLSLSPNASGLSSTGLGTRVSQLASPSSASTSPSTQRRAASFFASSPLTSPIKAAQSAPGSTSANTTPAASGKRPNGNSGAGSDGDGWHSTAKAHTPSPL